MAQGRIVVVIEMKTLQTMFDETLILVVSADQHISSVLNSNLTEAGLKPVFVSSAAKAVSILTHAMECGSPISLILYDNELPEMTSQAFANFVRNDKVINDSNIIALTRENPAGLLNQLGRWQITHVLHLPCRYKDLTGAIAEYIPVSKTANVEFIENQIVDGNGSYRILCADDNAINLAVLRGFLNISGYSPDTVVDGSQAVKAYKNIQYDLILMDIMMPVMDGVVATLQIRELEKQMSRPPVPIVAVTAHYTPSQRDRYLAAGMNDVIAKPINMTDIEDCLSTWCKRYVAPEKAQANHPRQAAFR